MIGRPRGKQLGGSSALNLMAWTHASQRDIDDWGKLGNQGWSWKSLLPYFLKSETYIAPSAQTAIDLDTNTSFDPSVHGEHGPVIHSFPEEHGPFQEAWWGVFSMFLPYLYLCFLFMLPLPSPHLYHTLNAETHFRNLQRPRPWRQR